jgi:hypothetical protein
MRLLAALLGSVSLALSLAGSGRGAQKQAEKFALSISVSEATFSPGRKAIVKVRIVNETSGAVSFSSFGRAEVILSDPSTSSEGCGRLSACYVASVSLGEGTKGGPAGGEWLEFEIDLADLHWKDAALSGRDLRRPKNMFTEVPPGGYDLIMRIGVPAEGSTPEEPRFAKFESNKLPVTVNGGNSSSGAPGRAV